MDWLKYLSSRAAGALECRSSDGTARLTRIDVDSTALLAPTLDLLLSALALLCHRYGREEEVSFLIRVQEPSGVSSWRARAALGESYSRRSIASALRRDPSQVDAAPALWLFVNFDAPKISEEIARAGVRAEEDLVLTVADGSTQVGALCDAGRYRRAAVVDLLENLIETLHALERLPADQPLQSIEFLSTAQLARLAEWSSGGRDGEPFIGLPQRFRKIVEQHGDTLAVRTRSERWSYRELERRAELVAAALRRHGVGRGSRVIVSQKREAALLASLLGVLKTAATYVAIEPGYPTERVAFIAEDTGAELILTDTNGAFPPGIPVLQVADACGSEAPEAELATPNATPVTPEDTAYILYTSGSTGKPKGVMIGHDSLDHFLRWSIAAHNLGPGDVTAALTSVLFDVSVCDLWTPLVSGAALALLATPAELFELSDVPRVAMMCAVPSAFQTEFGLKRALSPEARGPRIGILNLAGEALDPTLASLITSRLRPNSLRNCYGPTEATVYATWAEVKDPSSISIGRPLPNMRAFVLDGSGNRVPPGVPGELCLAGLGVARGYLNRDELNAERFVRAHFDDEPRLYRTGDLVRYRDDGALLFLGRADHQIKLNGYRIELGEVESAILRRTGVRQCAVLPLTLGRRGTVLVGCIQAGCGETPAGIVRKLAPLLPEYMIPTQWLEVESFPVTVSGKLDRVALQRTVAARFMPQSRHQPTDGVQT